MTTAYVISLVDESLRLDPVNSITVAEEDDFLSKLISEATDDSRTLKAIDPYGLVIFNEIQIDWLISELELSQARNAQDKKFLSFLASFFELVNRAKEEDGLYLRIEGN